MPRGLACVVVAVLVAVALLGTGQSEPAAHERTHVTRTPHEAPQSSAVDSQPRLAAAGGLGDAAEATHVATSPKAIARRRERSKAKGEGAEEEAGVGGQADPVQTEEQRRAGTEAFGVQDSAPKRARLRGAPPQARATADGDGSGSGDGSGGGELGTVGATGVGATPPTPPRNQTARQPPPQRQVEGQSAASNKTVVRPPRGLRRPRRRPARGKRAGKGKRDPSPLGQ